jgi:hypothetical protein
MTNGGVMPEVSENSFSSASRAARGFDQGNLRADHTVIDGIGADLMRRFPDLHRRAAQRHQIERPEHVAPKVDHVRHRDLADPVLLPEAGTQRLHMAGRAPAVGKMVLRHHPHLVQRLEKPIDGGARNAGCIGDIPRLRTVEPVHRQKDRDAPFKRSYR